MRRVPAEPARLRGLMLVAAACAVPALAFFRIYFMDPPQAAARELLYPNPLYESQALGGWLRERSRPDDALYVFGSEPELYIYSGLRPSTPNIAVLPLTMSPRPGPGKSELAALSARPPRFVVWSGQPFSTMVGTRAGEAFRDGVRALLERRYRFAGAMPVLPEPSASPAFVPAGGPPDWTSENSLLVFERREL